MGEGDDTTRVLAVTSDPTLVIGLTFLSEEWDVASQGDLDGDATAEVDVLVIDLGSTRGALDALAALGRPRPPAVVVGDEPAEELPDDVRIVARPYTLSELAAEVEAVVRPPADITLGATGGPLVDEGATVVRLEAVTPPAPDPPDEPQPASRAEPPAEPAKEDEPAGPAQEDPPAEPVVRREAPAPPDAGDVGHGSGRRSRWIGRRLRSADGAERALRERLAAALTASTELERLVGELPLLRSFDGLARAVVDTAAEQLAADTAALWRRGDDGWHAVAHQGLTGHEARLIVPLDHPLFAEVDATGGGLLIDPVDSAQAAVAGVGGAHTTSFAAASIAVGPGRYGLLTVGRDDSLTAGDLDDLLDLGVEAALGLALADWFERMVGLATPSNGRRIEDEEPSDEPDDGGGVVVHLPREVTVDQHGQ